MLGQSGLRGLPSIILHLLYFLTHQPDTRTWVECTQDKEDEEKQPRAISFPEQS
jgi:hypothetical protein